MAINNQSLQIIGKVLGVNGGLKEQLLGRRRHKFIPGYPQNRSSMQWR
jgi:hypothetical protein